MKKYLVHIAVAVLLAVPAAGQSATEHELLDFVDTALRQSDVSYDIRDSMTLSQMDINTAEHTFDTKIIPLTSIGFTQGTGSQKLGLELRKEVETGASISYGLVGDRVDEDSNYVVENSHVARAYVRVSQGLFRRWGKEYNRTDLDVAELRDRQKELAAEKQMQQLILSTAKKYYTMVLEDQLLIKSREALNRSKEHLESAASRQSVGLVSKVDVYRAELAMLTAENELQVRTRERERAIEDFRELLRLSMQDDLSWQQEISKIIPVIPDTESVDEVIFENRLDWQEYLMRTQISKREKYQVDRNLMPDVGLSFTVEQRGEGDSIEDAAELDETNWSLQLEMRSSLDTFSEESALLRKKMELSKLRREGDALRRRISRELRDGLADLQVMERKHQLSIRRLEQASLALELAQIRYEKGLSDNLDVIDAEAAYSDAELSIMRSLVSYNNAAISLANVMGILNTDWLRMSISQEETL